MPLEADADADGDVQATGHPEEEELVPVETDSEIILAAAMDDHWLVAGIVADRTADLCANPVAILLMISEGYFTKLIFWSPDPHSLHNSLIL